MWIFNCSSPYIFNGAQVYSFRKKTYIQWSCKVIVQRRDQTNYFNTCITEAKTNIPNPKESNICSKHMKNQIFYGQVRDNLRFHFSLYSLSWLSLTLTCSTEHASVLELVACRSKVEVDNPSITKCPWIKPGSLVHLSL